MKQATNVLSNLGLCAGSAGSSGKAASINALFCRESWVNVIGMKSKEVRSGPR